MVGVDWFSLVHYYSGGLHTANPQRGTTTPGCTFKISVNRCSSGERQAVSNSLI